MNKRILKDKNQNSEKITEFKNSAKIKSENIKLNIKKNKTAERIVDALKTNN